MTDIRHAHDALIARVLGSGGRAPGAMRRAAFDNAGLEGPLRALIDKVARHAYQITDEDIASVLAAGLSEDQVFEIVVCGAIGEATRMYGRGRAALDAAAGER